MLLLTAKTGWEESEGVVLVGPLRPVCREMGRKLRPTCGRRKEGWSGWGLRLGEGSLWWGGSCCKWGLRGKKICVWVCEGGWPMLRGKNRSGKRRKYGEIVWWRGEGQEAAGDGWRRRNQRGLSWGSATIGFLFGVGEERIRLFRDFCFA
jgi:hypothetical protein